MPLWARLPAPFCGHSGPQTGRFGRILSTMMSLVDATSQVVLPAVSAVFERG